MKYRRPLTTKLMITNQTKCLKQHMHIIQVAVSFEKNEVFKHLEFLYERILICVYSARWFFCTCMKICFGMCKDGRLCAVQCLEC